MEELQMAEGQDLRRPRYLVNRKLANACLEQAILTRQDPNIAERYIDSLKQLSVARDERSTTNRGLDATTKQVLIQYYALTGQTEKAKDTPRAHIKTDLDLLSDEDLTNDYQGCRGLWPGDPCHVCRAG